MKRITPQLYQTVRCYLENHQSVTKTSEALFIHRSTLLYRLDKIKDILKTDFSDPDELLYLLLSFHLLDMEDQQQTPETLNEQVTGCICHLFRAVIIAHAVFFCRDR